uniref:Uncharacterized protein n=1 Tax=Anguilla anguilla TaxID=7936 RepID=A0A0E9SY92_ANGAN
MNTQGHVGEVCCEEFVYCVIIFYSNYLH